MDSIRYDTNGRDLICSDCYREKINKKSANISASSTARKEEVKDRIKVICTDCRYKFSIKPGSNVALRCPYCGKNRLVKDQTSVDELIREVAEKGEVY